MEQLASPQVENLGGLGGLMWGAQEATAEGPLSWHSAPTDSLSDFDVALPGFLRVLNGSQVCARKAKGAEGFAPLVPISSSSPLCPSLSLQSID